MSTVYSVCACVCVCVCECERERESQRERWRWGICPIDVSGRSLTHV